MKTKFGKQVVFALIFLLNASIGIAQNDPKAIVNSFFADYKDKGASIAIDNLYATSNWKDSIADAIANLKNQLEGLNEDYVGKYYGYEFMIEKKITERYVLLSYLIRYERQPIRFTFQFYKPGDTWFVYGFQYDANIDTEIEEAAKLNNNLK